MTTMVETSDREIERAMRAVEKAATKLHAAEQERERAIQELAAKIRHADSLGVVRSRLVEQSGLARQTVYNILGGLH